MKPLLLIGYGNPGRGDDGLGPALVERLETLDIGGIELMSDYQLTVDMAHDIASFESVVFADAAMTGPAPFSFSSTEPGAPLSFTSHSQRPEGVLYLAQTLFGGRAQGHLLGIRGYQFGQFNEELSPEAERNLEATVGFVVDDLLPNREALVSVRS